MIKRMLSSWWPPPQELESALEGGDFIYIYILYYIHIYIYTNIFKKISHIACTNTSVCAMTKKLSVAMSCVCSYPFFPPTRLRGSSNQDDFYVTAQALPFGMHNWTKHPWAALELPSCHRQSLHHPRSRRNHLPESQQRPVLRLESGAHPWADLELPNCPRQVLHHPR